MAGKPRKQCSPSLDVMEMKTKNHSEIPLRIHGKNYKEKDRQQLPVRRWRRGPLKRCWREGKMMGSLWKTVWQLLEKSNVKLVRYPSIPLLSIYSREVKTCLFLNVFCVQVHTKTCTQKFTAALFVIAKGGNKLKVPQLAKACTKRDASAPWTLLSDEKEGRTGTRCSADEPRER